MGRRGMRILATLMLVLTVIGALPAEGASLAKAMGRAAARGLLKRGVLPRQKLGPLHRFRRPTALERYTNRPRTDKVRGLPHHSFWIRQHPGRKGSPAHVQKRLNIPHPVKRREVLVARPGMKYHERPIKGGAPHQREVILEKPVPGKAIKLKPWRDPR